jgi:hypothetical protein
MSAGETTERLRRDIDSGRTGDKVPGSDPSAAPLGADDEAAGRPPARHRVAQTRFREIARPHAPGDHRGLGHAWILVAFTLVLAAAIVAWTALTRANAANTGAGAVVGAIAR